MSEAEEGCGMYITGEVVILEVEGDDIRVQSYIVRIAPEISTRSLSSLSVIDSAEPAVDSAEADHSTSNKGGSGTRMLPGLFRAITRPARSAIADLRAWKPEHRRALVLAMGLGALIGGLYGLHGIDERPSIWEWYSFGCDKLLWRPWLQGAILGFYVSGTCLSVRTYWVAVVGWSAFAAMAAGALVYIRQLLRM
jgi:hypothetical protein